MRRNILYFRLSVRTRRRHILFWWQRIEKREKSIWSILIREMIASLFSAPGEVQGKVSILFADNVYQETLYGAIAGWHTIIQCTRFWDQRRHHQVNRHKFLLASLHHNIESQYRNKRRRVYKVLMMCLIFIFPLSRSSAH